MIKLKNWNAKRAGAGITIQGVNISSCQIVKVVGVREIYPGAIGLDQYACIARTDDAEYQLLMTP